MARKRAPVWHGRVGSLRAIALVYIYSICALLALSCPVIAFPFAAKASLMRRRRSTATSTTVIVRSRRSSSSSSRNAGSGSTSPATAPEDLASDSEAHIESRDDDDGEEDEFDDDEIHPSVAWLYPAAPSTSQHASSTGRASSSSRDHKQTRRKPSRRTLCVDYGTFRVGLAIGVGISPRAVPGITNRGSDLEVARQVLVRARGEGIRDIVVGLPLYRDGTETEMCEIVRSFASVLADVGAVSRPSARVLLWDERFSSAQARAMLDPYGGGMSSKVEVDSLAASLILQHFFEEGGADNAETVEASTGVVTAEVMAAAGRSGEDEEDEEGEEDAYGEGSRRRFQEMREESARSMAAGEDLGSKKVSRKRRRR